MNLHIGQTIPPFTIAAGASLMVNVKLLASGSTGLRRTRYGDAWHPPG
jgi:hypothetical protein